jgi:hypothetical protein
MSWISIAAAPAHFVAGLALLALAGMFPWALRRTAARNSAVWGVAAWAALGLAEWCSVPTAAPTILQSAGLGFELLALVALVELGLRSTGGRRGGLLPRWSYFVIAALALVALPVGWLSLSQFICRLVLAWQAVWLAVNQPGWTSETSANEQQATLAEKAIGGGLVVYLVVACFAFPLLGALALMVAAAAAYLTLGPAAGASRQAKLLWRCSWPVGFVLIAVGGCSILAARNRAENPTLAVLEIVESSEGASGEDNNDRQNAEIEDQAGAELDHGQAAGDSRPQNRRTLMHQVKRLGMGVVPIVLFVLLVWGLSRLPCVH